MKQPDVKDSSEYQTSHIFHLPFIFDNKKMDKPTLAWNLNTVAIKVTKVPLKISLAENEHLPSD